MKALLPLADAERVASLVLEELAPSCARIEIAGSLRRKKPQVGDIELVAIPRMAPGQMDLFGAGVERNLLEEQCARLLDAGYFAHRPDKNGHNANGERFKRLVVGVHDGVPLDLFIVRPPRCNRCALPQSVPGSLARPRYVNEILCPNCGVADWSAGSQFGVIYTIRTGCAEFSHRLVTSRLLGGWLPAGAKVRDGAVWEGETALPMPEERDVFAYLGVPWLPPDQRTPTVRLMRRNDGHVPYWIEHGKAVEWDEGGH